MRSLQSCLGGFVVALGVCDLDYLGLCVRERLRLTDFVVMLDNVRA